MVKHTSATLLLAVLLSGCGNGTVSEKVQNGNTALSQKDYRTATIEFKSALQQSPGDVGARLGLATILIQERKFSDASMELEAALSSSQISEKQKSEIYSMLAYSHYELKNIEKLTTLPKDVPAVSYFLLLDTRKPGTPLSSTSPGGNGTDAEFIELYNLANSFFEKETKEALSPETLLLLIDKFKNPVTKSNAALLLAEMGALNQDPDLIIQGLTIHTGVFPSDAARQLQLADLLITIQKHSEAKPIVSKLYAQNKEHPLLNELMAAIALSESDYDNALSYSRVSVANNPRSQRGRMIAALSEAGKNQPRLAIEHLEFIKDSIPAEHPIRLLYIDLLMQEKEYKKATDYTLVSLPKSKEQIDQLARVGLNMSNIGMQDDARLILEHLKKLSKEKTLNMGMLELAMNDKSGLDTLVKLREDDPTSTLLNHSVAAAYLAVNDNEGALRLAEEWSKGTDEQKVESKMLSAVVASKKEDWASSAALYKEIVGGNPKHALASAGVIESLIKSQNIKEAQEFLLKSLNLDFTPLLLKSYGSAMQSIGKFEDAESFLSEHVKKTSSDHNHEIDLLFAQSYFLKSEHRKTIDLLTPHEDKMKDRVDYWVTLAFAAQAISDKKMEAKAFTSWLKITPESKPALLGAISALESSGEVDQSLALLESSKQYHESSEVIDLLSLQIMVKHSRWSDVKSLIPKLPNETKALPEILGYEGMSMAVAGDDAQAERRLKIALKANADPNVLKFLVTVQERNKKVSDALESIESYVERKKEDSFGYLLMGNNRGLASDWVSAEVAFEKAHSLGERSPMILNNYAYTLLKNGKVTESISMAKEALAKQPDNIQVKDTLASAYVKADRPSEAIDLLLPLYQQKKIEQDELIETLLDALIAENRLSEAAGIYGQYTWQDKSRSSRFDNALKPAS